MIQAANAEAEARQTHRDIYDLTQALDISRQEAARQLLLTEAAQAQVDASQQVRVVVVWGQVRGAGRQLHEEDWEPDVVAK